MEKTYGYVTTAFNVLSDFYLVILPIPVVLSLHMSAQKKIRVISIFMLGFLGCICGIINSYYRVVLARTGDTTYFTAPVLLASITEINVGIVVGCMPVIQPTLMSGFAKTFHLAHVHSLFSRLIKSKASNQSPVTSTQHHYEKAHSKPYISVGIQ
ncbi:hypothetical protein GJ744_001345 [Endocarpon pusillum]|uniref:Rhodopsin domain-containing protein n=1 Tax=Endocarpon pusillum TaxID=364733 RepID=A0A8H7E8J4_9EURO|nr:hypothetical protein GJ744_001345 [Endocarpon pusillum]